MRKAVYEDTHHPATHPNHLLSIQHDDEERGKGAGGAASVASKRRSRSGSSGASSQSSADSEMEELEEENRHVTTFMLKVKVCTSLSRLSATNNRIISTQSGPCYEFTRAMFLSVCNICNNKSTCDSVLLLAPNTPAHSVRVCLNTASTTPCCYTYSYRPRCCFVWASSSSPHFPRPWWTA
jgi:hypothetical protein